MLSNINKQLNDFCINKTQSFKLLTKN